jgi:hypothetical protein
MWMAVSSRTATIQTYAIAYSHTSARAAAAAERVVPAGV